MRGCTSSAQNRAHADERPGLPGRGRRRRIVSSSTNSTDASETLPTRARLSQVIAERPAGQVERRGDACSTFRPPG